MRKLKSIGTNISETNYSKVWEFLEEYNRRTKENLTMSQLVWKAVKIFVIHTRKSWKG